MVKVIRKWTAQPRHQSLEMLLSSGSAPRPTSSYPWLASCHDTLTEVTRSSTGVINTTSRFYARYSNNGDGVYLLFVICLMISDRPPSSRGAGDPPSRVAPPGCSPASSAGHTRTGTHTCTVMLWDTMIQDWVRIEATDCNLRLLTSLVQL